MITKIGQKGKKIETPQLRQHARQWQLWIKRGKIGWKYIKWASFCNQSSYFPERQSIERLICRAKQRQIELISRTEKSAATQSCNLEKNLQIESK